MSIFILNINFIFFPQQCMMHTWYIACDMQLYLASLLVILPLIRQEIMAIFHSINNLNICVYNTTYVAILSKKLILIKIFQMGKDRSNN